MKRIATVTSVLIAGCLAGGAVAAEKHDSIPEQFQGTWAVSDSACAQGTIAESILTIDPTQLEFYSSRSQVLAAVVADDAELALILEYSGEGETWLGTAQFQLSADEQELTHISRGFDEFTRVRCSPN